MTACAESTGTLLAWCHSNGIKIDSRLELVCSQADGLGIFSRSEIDIDTPASLQIPKSAVLSVKSCSVSNYINPIPYGHGAQLALSLAVYTEVLLGKESRWFGYIQSLPQCLVNIALFWGCDDVEPAEGHDGTSNQNQILDGKEALAWLRGTEVQRQLQGSDETGLSLLEQIRQYYHGVVEPLLAIHRLGNHQEPSLSGFYHAYSLVSSRAFLVDAYHGLAMVPIADAFNHAHANHVHLESDYDVCMKCGSLNQCPHDDSDDESMSAGLGPSSRSTVSRLEEESLAGQDLDGYYEMICNAPISPNCEVFNTYGDKLSNAQLLVQYGFSLDGNENDCITWTAQELFEFSKEKKGRDVVTELWIQVIQEWADDWHESDSVYSAALNPSAGILDLRLNGDSKISHHLWLYCALLNLDDTRLGIKGGIRDEARKAAEQLQGVARVQRLLETAYMMGEHDEAAVGEGDLSKIVIGTIRTVAALCRSRRANIGKTEAYVCSAYELGEIIDVSTYLTWLLEYKGPWTEVAAARTYGATWSEHGWGLCKPWLKSPSWKAASRTGLD